MSSLSARYGYLSLKWGFLIGMTLLFAWTVWEVFLPGSFITSGNLHDLFIPYNAALARLQGMVLHRDFHTPFGWIYAELNMFAWRVLRQGGIAGVNELIPMASLLWMGLVVTLYAAFLLALPSRLRPSTSRAWLFSLFLLLVVFNFKGSSGFSVRELNWYGTYNNHLWGLLFVQMAGVFLLSCAQPSTRGVLALAALNGVGVFLAFNYKVSFGLSALALAVAPIFSNWAGLTWRLLYAGVGVALSFALSVGLAPHDYDFRLYLADIGVAALAKADNKGAIVGLDAWFAAALAWVLVAAKQNLDHVRIGGQDALTKWPWVAQMLFSGLIVGAALVAIMGDFSRPVFFFFVCLALYVLMCPAGQVDVSQIWWIRAGASTVLIVGIVAYMASDLRVARYKRHPIGAVDGNYQPVVWDTPYGPLKWTIRKEAGYGVLNQMFKMDEHPQRLLVQSAITYRAHPYRDNLAIAFKNLDYVAAISALQGWTSHGAMGVVTVLDFINPMPMLMGTPMPSGSLHWLHFGTSIPISGQDELVFGALAASDVVAVPVTSFDSNGQSLLNCRFHEWNRTQAHPFVAFASGRFHMLYQRDPKVPLQGLDEADIVQRCAVLLRQFRSGVISPN